MRIVFTEVSGLNGQGESVFEQPAVRVGRDPAQCHVVFDRATWPMVSRRHGEFRSEGGRCLLVDTNSSFGTFLDGQRLKAPAEVRPGSLVQFGAGGPVLRITHAEPDAGTSEPARWRAPRPSAADGADTRPFPSVAPASEVAPSRPSPAAPSHHPQARPQFSSRPEEPPSSAAELQATLYAAEGIRPAEQQPSFEEGRLRPLQLRAFGDAPYITVGRAPGNDIRLDSLQVSGSHARFVKDENGVLVEDRGSTNGVYLNGARVAPGRKVVRAEDVVQVGPFLLRADRERGVAVYDTRSKTRIDAVGISKAVAAQHGGTLKLLDGVDLTIQPNEFVGLLGPSGAGKSTLMDALNGMRPPGGGRVFVNDLDLYRNLDSLKHSIGYVPQDDIIHRELTVYRTLYYVARLRLSRDVSPQETDEIIEEVLEVTGLTERRDVPVGRLSGGQRKRVSIAVELITKPSVIFLDEPTSGLDPATEEKIMKLFRRIAESGRTVVLTTHATANVHLFDKVVVMMHGRLVFYGTPAEALGHFRVAGFKELYDALKSPGAAASGESAANGGGDEDAAEEWRRRFHATEMYRRNVALPRGELNPVRQADAGTRRRPDLAGAVRQWAILVRRYAEIITRDRANLLVLLGQAPVIALLTHLVVDAKAPRDFPYFTLALVATWFGSSLAAREIVKERAVYRRERMVNLGLLPYVASKVFTLALVVGAQCALLLGTLKGLHYAKLTYLPGSYGGLPQLLVMVLTGVVGLSLGLCVSASVKTSETATSLVPLLLIPQILFSGLVGAPQGVARVASAAMPVTWSFDEMKRLSTLGTLNEEGSIARYVEEKGRGGTKRAREEVEDYGRKTRESLEDYGRRVEQYLIDVQADPGLVRPRPPALADAPRIDDAPGADDLKEFVSFTHPWGGAAFDPFVLLMMALFLIGGTVTVLRAQDAA